MHVFVVSANKSYHNPLKRGLTPFALTMIITCLMIRTAGINLSAYPVSTQRHHEACKEDEVCEATTAN